MIKGGGHGEWGSLAPGVFLQVTFMRREVDFPTTFVVMCEMAGNNPLSKEASHEGCNYSRCGVDRVVGDSGKGAKEIQSLGGGGENPGERWFNLENMPAKRRSLLRLEHELDASLWFE